MSLFGNLFDIREEMTGPSTITPIIRKTASSVYMGNSFAIYTRIQWYARPTKLELLSSRYIALTI
jgi:hypothetical protein